MDLWACGRTEIKLKDFGLESVEVIDNGTGIEEEDWPYIGKFLAHAPNLPLHSLLSPLLIHPVPSQASAPTPPNSPPPPPHLPSMTPSQP